MRFIKGTVLKNHVMHGTGRDENKSRHPCPVRSSKKSQRTHEVVFEKAFEVIIPGGVERPLLLPLQSRVDHGINAVHERCDGRSVGKLSRHPLDRVL
jgi:hypothetical protein